MVLKYHGLLGRSSLAHVICPPRLALRLRAQSQPVSSSSSGSGGTQYTRQRRPGMGKLRRTVLRLAPPTQPPESRFKVLQWNILADGLAQNGDFVKVPPEVLEWEYRLPLVLDEVAESRADVICFQELNHYPELLAQLQPRGYNGTFQPKHCSPAERYKCPADGLAIFYSTSRFELVGEPLGQIFLDDSGQKQSQGFLQVRLHDRRTHQEVVVVTTHLKAKDGPVEDAMRSRQMRQLLHHLKPELLGREAQALPQAGPLNGALSPAQPNSAVVVRGPYGACASLSVDEGPASSTSGAGTMATGGNGESPRSGSVKLPPVPVIITGDFNATPESEPCKELKAHPAGFVSIWDVRPVRPSMGEIGNGNGRGLYNSNGSSNGARSVSVDGASTMAYSSWEEPQEGDTAGVEFSTWKFRSKGESKRIIDHIWFTGNRALRPTARWRMLNEAEIGPTALPCPEYASDHMALCAEFEWDALRSQQP